MRTANQLVTLRMLDAFLANPASLQGVKLPDSGWFQTVRITMGYTRTELGNAAELSLQAITNFERSEASGTIQLASLRKLAGTMFCDVVYWLAPKPGGRLAEEPKIAGPQRRTKPQLEASDTLPHLTKRHPLEDNTITVQVEKRAYSQFVALRSLATLSDIRSVKIPAGGWLRTVRVASKMSLADVAEKAGCHKQSVYHFERSEAAGKIELRNLRKLAEAMDCDLAYFLVPRADKAKTFSELAAFIVEPDPSPVEPPDIPPAIPAKLPPPAAPAPVDITADILKQTAFDLLRKFTER